MRILPFLLVFTLILGLAQPVALCAQPGPGKPGPGLQGPGNHPPGPPPHKMEDDHKMKRLVEEWAKGRNPEDVESYMKQVRQIREKSELWIQMAHLYMEKKDTDRALETIRKVFAIAIPEGPLKAEMEKKKGRLYLMAVNMAFESGNEAEAQKLIDEAIRNYPDEPEVAFQLYRRLADIQRKKGNTDEALKMLEKAESLLNQLK